MKCYAKKKRNEGGEYELMLMKKGHKFTMNDEI